MSDFLTGDNVDRLCNIREWAAVGLYESLLQGDPWALCCGNAWRTLYENMDIVVPDDHYLMPYEPIEYAQPWSPEIADDMSAMGVSRILGPESCLGMRFNRAAIKLQKERFPEREDFIDRYAEDLWERVGRHVQLVHASVNMRRMLDEGIEGMAGELREELDALRAEGRTADPDELHLLSGMEQYVEGVRAFHRRACRTARKAADGCEGEERRIRTLVADALENALLEPAETFYEGLVTVNFAWMLDGCDNIGRLDQLLGDRFEADREAGRLDLEIVRRLLDDLWTYFHLWNGWQIQIGGYTAEGEDGCNALTRECLLAAQRNRLHKPSLSLRVNRDTPDEILMEALRTIRCGAGQPALYNDERYITLLRKEPMNIPQSDVYEYGFGGCTEVLINGLSNIGSHTNRPLMNVPWALQWALHDGYDPVAERQEGPRTGEFTAFEDFPDFLGALKRQLQFLTDRYVTRVRADYEEHAEKAPPMIHRSFLVGDCVRKRKSFLTGGARYNWNYLNYVGISTFIDSAAAVRHCVFDRATVGAGELMEALAADFQGYEEVQRRLLAAPKFGNDDPYVDDLAAQLVEFMWSEVVRHEHPRGGRFVPACIPHGLYGPYGRRIGATPDGRRSRKPLGDSIGAFQGRDRNGPTALLRSVTKLPLHRAVATPVLNMRLPKGVLCDEAELRKLADLVRGYFDSGGLHVQISVLDTEELRAAKKHPEEYGDLIVRIGGYSEYFVALSEEMQESVIQRTGHTFEWIRADITSQV